MHRLLLLGTGGIAGHHVEEFGNIPECRIVACVDQAPGRAEKFAAANGIAEYFDSLDAAIAWGEFDAAINATPDGAHKATTLALIAAGKHVFCEKPLAPTHADALAMTEAAEPAGLVNMVNLTYRNSPALQQARAMVEAGEIGELRHVEAAYRQSWLVSKAWGDWRTMDQWLWRLSTRHGSTGVLGDVGIHILDFASFGAADDFVSLKADLADLPEGRRRPRRRLCAGRQRQRRHAGEAEIRRAGDRCCDALRHRSCQRPVACAPRHKWRAQDPDRWQASKLTACLGKDIDRARWQKIETPPVLRNARRFADALASGVNGDPSFRRAADIQKLIDAAFESSASGQAAMIS